MLKSNKTNLAIIISALLMSVFLISLNVPTNAKACAHTETYTTVVTASSCEQGMVERVCCEECHEILQNISHSAPGHEFSDFEETVYDPVSGITVETRKCKKCGIEETRTNQCAHTFTDWEYAPEATPVSTGYRIHTCTLCGRTEEEYYVEQMQKHEIYIPDSNIRSTYAVVTGKSIITSDLGESVTYIARCILPSENSSNPYVFGSYGFENLPNVKAGQYVYLSVDGRVLTYEVIASEFALMVDDTITGTTSGIDFTEHSEEESVLRIYTEHDNGYWIVFAKMISDGSDINIVT